MSESAVMNEKVVRPRLTILPGRVSGTCLALPCMRHRAAPLLLENRPA